MTIQNGRFDPEEKEEILNQLIAGAESAFGQELDADATSVIRAFYEPIAEYLASQQEDIRDTLDSAQIEHAEGQALDLLAALIGVTRREATPASVRLTFDGGAPVTRDYAIPEGTVAQTDAVDAVKFDTNYATTLKYLEGFEDGTVSDYGNDTGAFSAVTSPVYDGTYALQSSSSSTGTIVDAGNEVEEGSVNHWRQYVNTGSVAGTCFAVKDELNHYRVILDEPAGEVRVESVDTGTATTVGSASVTLPTGEWLDVEFDWRNDEDFVLYIEDSAGNQVLSDTFTESDKTYTNGGIGFYTGDTASNAYWDHLRMSKVSVDATCTEAGTVGNVGGNSLIVMPDAPTGITSVTNRRAADGGLDRELDDDFRERAKTELSDGMRATLPAIINGLDKLEGTRSVTVIPNDSSSTDGEGRPSHSFEAIVDANSEHYYDIAERILERKAAGDNPVGGYVGTKVTRNVELVNGQEIEVAFSTPTQVQIYVDCDLTKKDTYAGDEQVKDNIVKYVGGTLSSLEEIDGELEVSDNVIYYQVVEAVMDVEGVHNITNLEIGTSSSPTGTSDVSIGTNESGYADATDSSMDITSSDA